MFIPFVLGFLILAVKHEIPETKAVTEPEQFVAEQIVKAVNQAPTDPRLQMPSQGSN